MLLENMWTLKSLSTCHWLRELRTLCVIWFCVNDLKQAGWFKREKWDKNCQKVRRKKVSNICKFLVIKRNKRDVSKSNTRKNSYPQTNEDIVIDRFWKKSVAMAVLHNKFVEFLGQFMRNTSTFIAMVNVCVLGFAILKSRSLWQAHFL